MHPRLDELRAVLDEASRASSAFEAATGLACPAGCGACCESPTVEATVLELLPLAAALWDEGRAETVLASIERSDDPTRCFAYEQAEGGPGRGRCREYAHRPLVCRLFGAGAFRHRTGRLELVTCGVRRAVSPHEVARAEAEVGGEVPAPVFAEHGLRVLGLDPHLGTERRPINEALAEAIAWVGLRRSPREGAPGP